MNYGISPTYGSVAHAPADVRADFIRKVYSLFFISVLVTIGVGWFCAQPTVAHFANALLPRWPRLVRRPIERRIGIC